MCQSADAPSRYTRRLFLEGGSLALVSFALGGEPLFLGRAALAAPAPAPFTRRKTVVALFQRGAMDGLMAVPTLDDATLRRLRPRLAMSAARSAGDDRLLDLDGRFGLHPALGALEPFFRDGRLAVVHGVGSPDPTRSHFDAQEYMETGTPGRKGTASGWLNRVAGLAGHEPTPFSAVALTPTLPRALAGEQAVVAATDLAAFGLRLEGARDVAVRAGAGFEALYAETSEGLLRRAGRESFEAVEMLDRAGVKAYRPAADARYPRAALGSALRQVAFLVKSGLGLEVAFVESSGWDTHVRQGTTNGTFANRARELAESVAAFWTDLGPHADDVVLLTMTEFGRTVAENGSGGTDHGHGSCLFVLGHRVDGGRVHGDLPALRESNLFEGRDLPVTTDFRAVFSAVAQRHLGIAPDATLFPGWTGTPLPLLRT